MLVGVVVIGIVVGSLFRFVNFAEIDPGFFSCSSSMTTVALFAPTQLFCFGVADGIGGNSVDLVFLTCSVASGATAGVAVGVTIGADVGATVGSS